MHGKSLDRVAGSRDHVRVYCGVCGRLAGSADALQAIVPRVPILEPLNAVRELQRVDIEAGAERCAVADRRNAHVLRRPLEADLLRVLDGVAYPAHHRTCLDSAEDDAFTVAPARELRWHGGDHDHVPVRAAHLRNIANAPNLEERQVVSAVCHVRRGLYGHRVTDHGLHLRRSFHRN
ncbi:hypothetical protein EPL73_20865 [Clostridioides difficile]|nr:hypothetical protein [Clostridioides difficile]